MYMYMYMYIHQLIIKVLGMGSTCTCKCIKDNFHVLKMVSKCFALLCNVAHGFRIIFFFNLLGISAPLLKLIHNNYYFGGV